MLSTHPEIVATDGVYPPSEDSDLLLSAIEIHPDETVLDMGTGSGFLAIESARGGGIVTAVDIAEEAIVCARKNAELNGVDPDVIRFLRSDLFAYPQLSGDIPERFDVILFNAPYLPTEEWSEDNEGDRTWNGGGDGSETIRRFLEQLPEHIGKRCYLLFSSLSGKGQTTMAELMRGRLLFHEVARKKLFFETLFVYEIFPTTPPPLLSDPPAHHQIH
jgi:release factor glutamine methyltransferase